MLDLAVFFLPGFENPEVTVVSDIHNQWQVVPTETRGPLPLLSVLVETEKLSRVKAAARRASIETSSC